MVVTARLAAGLHAGGLFVDRMPASVGGDEHTTVMDLHQPALTDHLDGLPGQPCAGLVDDGGEPDRALGADPPCRHRPRRRARPGNGLAGFSRGSASWNRSIGGTPPID